MLATIKDKTSVAMLERLIDRYVDTALRHIKSLVDPCCDYRDIQYFKKTQDNILTAISVIVGRI